MPLKRGYAFKGAAEYRAQRAADAKKRQSSARKARISYQQVGFPIPLPSTAPALSLESKSVQYTQVTNSMFSDGQSIQHCNVVTQGAGNSQRLGNKYRCTGISIKGRIETVVDSRCIAGYYLVWDKQSNKAMPAASDIFTLDGSGSLHIFNTGLKVGGRERFTIVGKYRTTLARTTVDNLPSLRDLDQFHKLPKWCVTTMQAGTTTGAMNTIVSGSLLLIPYSNLGDNPPQIKNANQLFFEEA